MRSGPLTWGQADFVRKPFHPGELLSRIGSLLQSERGKILLSETGFANRGYISRPKVSVVIPTLNEAQNLPLVLPHLPLEWIDEVILVDGRSKDSTVETARALLPSIKVILETLSGKGAAMQAGFQASSGEIIIVLDADGSHDPARDPPVHLTPCGRADFCQGQPVCYRGRDNGHAALPQAGNSALTILVNFLFNVNFTTCAMATWPSGVIAWNQST